MDFCPASEWHSSFDLKVIQEDCRIEPVLSASKEEETDAKS
jgi:hypothetical protein